MSDEDNDVGVSVRFRRGTAEDVRKLAIQAFAERYDVRGPFWLIPREEITLEEFRRRWPKQATYTVERMTGIKRFCAALGWSALTSAVMLAAAALIVRDRGLGIWLAVCALVCLGAAAWRATMKADCASSLGCIILPT